MLIRLHPAAQAAVLLTASLLAGVMANQLRTQPLSWSQNWSDRVVTDAKKTGVPVVGPDEARAISVAHSHIILDARPAADFAAGHIPGSFSMPASEIEKALPQVLPLLTPAQPVMAYCSGHQCDESMELAKRLIQNGFTNVVLFADGWAGWTAAKLPVEK